MAAILQLKDAIGEFVRDGDIVACEGFTHLIPFAAGHEIIRQKRRDLTVIRRLPLRAQVGRAHLVEIEVFNHKLRVPSYAIEVEDLRAGQPADKRCFFLKISPKSAQVAAYRRLVQR